MFDRYAADFLKQDVALADSHDRLAGMAHGRIEIVQLADFFLRVLAFVDV